MENQKEKTVFEYYFVAASVSHLQARGSTWWTLIFFIMHYDVLFVLKSNMQYLHVS